MKIRIIEQDSLGTWVETHYIELERIPTIGEKVLLPSKAIQDGLNIHEVIDVVFREGCVTEVFAKEICGQNRYNKYVRK
ncbi:hypothetical protein [Alistipes sp.]|uniref:hypothetical protein n=1 Tax=Alistipes sp. TaxID=1872444 RepID=UPI003AEF88E1